MSFGAPENRWLGPTAQLLGLTGSSILSQQKEVVRLQAALVKLIAGPRAEYPRRPCPEAAALRGRQWMKSSRALGRPSSSLTDTFAS